MITWLCNAFSMSMLPPRGSMQWRVIDARHAARIVSNPGYDDNVESAVGHADTAKIFSEVLGVPVAHNRINVHAAPGDEFVVGQYIGPRLPEGATALPEGAVITWYHVDITGPAGPVMSGDAAADAQQVFDQMQIRSHDEIERLHREVARLQGELELARRWAQGFGG